MKKTQVITISHEELVEALIEWLDASGTYLPMYGKITDIDIAMPLDDSGRVVMDVELTFTEEDTSGEDREHLDAWLRGPAEVVPFSPLT